MASVRHARRVMVARQGLAVIVLGIVFAGVPTPHASGQSDDSAREIVTLEGNHADVQFLVGRSVRIRANVTDDVFAAGRDVTLDSATVKNAIVAGYDVEQRGGTIADMITAAANINIAGTIEDDLVAAARSMRISSGGSVGGDARVAAETIDMEGRIEGSMRAAARRITIAGEIGGKVDLLAERIVIAPGANIAGDVIYRSRAEPEIADGARIGGEVRRVALDMPNLRSIGLTILRIGLIIALAWAIAMLLLITIIQLAFPGLMADAAERIRAHPWSSLGRGIAVLILAGALAGLLVASVVGIPLGGALSMGIAIVWLLGLAAVSYCIGLLIRGRMRRPVEIRRAGRVGWAIAGAILLGLIALVPLIGWIVVGLAVAAGFGASAAELWQRLRTA